jgi:hypothetical protein
MKLSSLAAARDGKRAESPITFPLAINGESQEVTVLASPLTGAEESRVLVFALEYAKAKGAEPKEGEPLFDLAVMVKTIELGILDPDSPPTARTPFADGGPDQVLELLGRETIAFLYEAQQQWQDMCSPSVRRVKAEELIEHIIALAEADDDLPFVRLSPGLRWICTRSMARLLTSSLGDKLDISSLSESIGAELKSGPAN